MNNPSLSKRIRAALNVFRNGYPTRQVVGAGNKAAPFAFPLYRSLSAQWHIVDYGSYVRDGFSLNTLIYSAIMYKVRSLAIAPLRAYTGNPDHPEPLPVDHPLSRLLARPNVNSSMAELQGLSTVYLNLSGNSYTLLDRSARNLTGVPTAMYALRPDRVFIIPEGNRVKGYLYVPEGKSRDEGTPILPQDLIHVKFPNPLDPLEGMGYGLSPISPMARSADVDNHITEFLKIFFEQGTMVNGLIRFKHSIDDPTLDRTRERWREVYGGYNNWAEVGILDQDAEYERIGMTFEEMGFEKLDERNESRLLGPFGVPPILIGSRIGLMRSTYANYKEARQAFWEDTLVPEMLLFEGDYQYYLQSEALDGFVAFDTSKVPALRKDVVTQVSAWAQLVDRGVPKNVAAEVVGLDLGQLSDGDTVYMPLSMVAVGVSAPEAATEEDEDNEGAVEATSDERDVEKGLALAGANGNGFSPYSLLGTAPAPPRGLPLGRATPPKAPIRATAPTATPTAPMVASSATRLSEAQRVGHWKAIDATARKWERPYRLAAQRAFGKDRDYVLAVVGEAQKAAYRRKATIDWQTPEGSVADYLNGGAADNWREQFVSLLQGTIADQGRRWAIELGMAFDVRNLFASQWFDMYTLEFAQPINATTLSTLGSMFQQAQHEGWSVPTMEARITSMFEQWMTGRVSPERFAWYQERLPAHRVEAIARTETMRASNAGTHQLFTDWGVAKEEWLATKDDRVRDAHLAADGQVVPIGQPFIVDGESLLYPLDPAGSPGNTINCRCTVLPVIGEEGLATQPAPVDEPIVQAGPAAQPGAYGPGAGPAVGNAVKFYGEGAARQAAEAAVLAIDKTHSDGSLPGLPLTTNQKLSSSSNLGEYQSGNNPYVAIRENVAGAHPRLTTAHEMGHFIDNWAKELFTGATSNMYGVVAAYASEHSPLLARWLEAIRATPEYKWQVEALQNDGAVYADAQGNPIDEVIRYSPSFIKYTLRARELWARSYAQYIAINSGDQTMLDELAEVQGSGYATQWSNENFEPVRKEFDKLFEDLGWRAPINPNP